MLPATAEGRRKEVKHMKKIYERIPLDSVLFIISGLARIKIVDKLGRYWEDPGCEERTLYEGLMKDFRKATFYEYKLSQWAVEHAEVHGISADPDGTIVLELCTRLDEN